MVNDPMRHSKTWDYYLCLVLVVVPLRAITILTPLGFVLLSMNQLHLCGTPLDPWLIMPLVLYCASETLFTVYFYVLQAKFHALHPAPPRLVDTYATRKHSHESVASFFDTLAHHIGDVQGWLEDWFFGTPFNHLSRHDLRTWLAYSLYSKPWTAITLAECSELDTIIDKIHIRSGGGPPNGTTHNTRVELQQFLRQRPIRSTSNLVGAQRLSTDLAPCMRHTIDPIEAHARPWLCYALTWAIDRVGAWMLSAHGFRRCVDIPGFVYWHRPALVGDENVAEPIVFVHGVGAGLAVYAPLLMRLCARYKHRQIFLPEIPQVSMQLGTIENVPARHDLLSACEAMLATNGVDKAHWVGHSLGTAVCSWVCQDKPSLVTHVTLVDPIVFCLWTTDVCFNFLYRDPPTQASNGVQLLTWYIASQEIGIAHYMRRHFWWYDVLCLPENLPRHPVTNYVAATVFLSSHDHVINGPAVCEYLQRGATLRGHDVIPRAEDSIDVTLWDGFHHGEMLFHKHAQDEILRSLDRPQPPVVFSNSTSRRATRRIKSVRQNATSVDHPSIPGKSRIRRQSQTSQGQPRFRQAMPSSDKTLSFPLQKTTLLSSPGIRQRSTMQKNLPSADRPSPGSTDGNKSDGGNQPTTYERWATTSFESLQSA
ncbi:Aste57867_1989 [Aphanomyces stellatus]|uniref:Aste57867_1989 protein n=1 Tax=Aphanomyces stellatus TaxID=120398 RepID=A0A485K7K2_9STRA|nr:hypothetical protein As57867_001987 [Aphanomyces stellatus]VFT79194.1 Aste57867_1989 [Aphanomyces stellatus]